MNRKEPKFKYANVMLVDDSELDNFINEKIIESNHFAKKVYITSSAKSALEFINNLIIMGEEYAEAYPDVIFIDINMPMMDGFQFIELFEKNTERYKKKPKLVILTSSVYHEDIQRAKDISHNIVFLNKPLSSELLSSV
jgi:CheY-like chemotaxis protein